MFRICRLLYKNVVRLNKPKEGNLMTEIVKSVNKLVGKYILVNNSNAVYCKDGNWRSLKDNLHEAKAFSGYENYKKLGKGRLLLVSDLRVTDFIQRLFGLSKMKRGLVVK